MSGDAGLLKARRGPSARRNPVSWEASCLERTRSAPSPTAAATRLVEPLRTSPTAKTSCRVVSTSRGDVGVVRALRAVLVVAGSSGSRKSLTRCAGGVPHHRSARRARYGHECVTGVGELADLDGGEAGVWQPAGQLDRAVARDTVDEVVAAKMRRRVDVRAGAGDRGITASADRRRLGGMREGLREHELGNGSPEGVVLAGDGRALLGAQRVPRRRVAVHEQGVHGGGRLDAGQRIGRPPVGAPQPAAFVRPIRCPSGSVN